MAIDDEVVDHDGLYTEIQVDEDDDEMLVEGQIEWEVVEKLPDIDDEPYEYQIYPNFILDEDDEADDFIIIHDIHDHDEMVDE